MGEEKDLKYLALCEIGAKLFSTCGKRQYYAIILDANGRFAGAGYNGAPAGATHCVDGGCPRFQNQTPAGAIYDDCVALHSEHNAISCTSPQSRWNGTIIVNGSPCWQCAKEIANSGLKRIVYLEDSYYRTDWPRVRESLLSWGMTLCGYNPSRLDFLLTRLG